MDVAVKRISAEHGAVGILVNNAGYAELGTIEEIALDDARVQLETNVLGPARLIQLVLPGMREQRFGRIINLSSLYGRFAVHGTGIYHASNMLWRALRGDGYLATAFAVRALDAGGNGHHAVAVGTGTNLVVQVSWSRTATRVAAARRSRGSDRASSPR